MAVTRVTKHPWPYRITTPGQSDPFLVSGLQDILRRQDDHLTWVQDAAPDDPHTGDRWANTATGTFNIYFGGTWQTLGWRYDDGTGLALDVRAFGIRNDARTLTNVSIQAGNLDVTCDPGVLTGEEVGWMFEIIGGGPRDSLVGQIGRTNWQGTIAAVNVAAGTFTATALPAPNTTPNSPSTTEQNPTASGLRAVVGVPVESGNAISTVFDACRALGVARIRFPEGRYVTRYGIQPPNSELSPVPPPPYGNLLIEGDGQERTIIYSFKQAPGIKCNQLENVTIRDLSVVGAGPDGGFTGIGNSTGCIDIRNSRHILVERVTAKESCNGFAVRMQDAWDVTLRDCRADGMYKSNGTYGPASSGGIGFWVFDASDIHLDHCTALNTDRHGIYFDPGTSTGGAAAQAPDQHGFLSRCSGVALHTANTNREGSGVGIGLSGCRLGEFSDLAVYAAGIIGTPACGVPYAPYVTPSGYGNDVIGLHLGGDQNGEYTVETLVTGVLLRDLAGLAISIQGVRNTLRGVRIVDFNRSQVAAQYAVVFESYGGFTQTNVLPGNDVTDNTVDGLDVYYTGSPTFYQYGVRFAGGTQVPDGSATTRARVTAADGQMTAGSTLLVSPSANFTTADQGLHIVVPGAGSNIAGGLALEASIAPTGYVNPTTVNLTAPAISTVTVAPVQIGYRNARCLRNAVLDARLGSVFQAAWARGGLDPATYCPAVGADANFIRMAAMGGLVHYEDMDLIGTANATPAATTIPGTVTGSGSAQTVTVGSAAGFAVGVPFAVTGGGGTVEMVTPTAVNTGTNTVTGIFVQSRTAGAVVTGLSATYTSDVLMPGQARLLDVQVLNFTQWSDCVAAFLNVGDYTVATPPVVQNATGYFGGIDVKAMAANKSISWAAGDAGVGAYAATYGRARYHGSARLIRASLFAFGVGGTAGRTRVLVAWAEPVLGNTAVKT